MIVYRRPKNISRTKLWKSVGWFYMPPIADRKTQPALSSHMLIFLMSGECSSSESCASPRSAGCQEDYEESEWSLVQLFNALSPAMTSADDYTRRRVRRIYAHNLHPGTHFHQHSSAIQLSSVQSDQYCTQSTQLLQPVVSMETYPYLCPSNNKSSIIHYEKPHTL